MVHVTSRISCTYKYPDIIHGSMGWWHGIISLAVWLASGRPKASPVQTSVPVLLAIAAPHATVAPSRLLLLCLHSRLRMLMRVRIQLCARFACRARGDCCGHGDRLRMRPRPAPAMLQHEALLQYTSEMGEIFANILATYVYNNCSIYNNQIKHLQHTYETMKHFE